MNTITIIGNIGNDIAPRFTASGQKVTSFNVATRSRKGGEEITIWYKVTIWGDRFDKMLPHLKKGSYIVVVGELGKPEIWQDKEGKNQIRLEITVNSLHFMPGNKGEGKPAEVRPLATSTKTTGTFTPFNEPTQEEELPF